jgi:hypothetical protein
LEIGKLRSLYSCDLFSFSNVILSEAKNPGNLKKSRIPSSPQRAIDIEPAGGRAIEAPVRRAYSAAPQYASIR